MNLLVSGSVLLLAVLAFFSYDMLSFRQSLINNLRAEAQIIGANSVSALTFDDPASAAATLQGLNRSPDVVSAVLTTDDGAVFANYGPPDDAMISGKHVLAHRRAGTSLAQRPATCSRAPHHVPGLIDRRGLHLSLVE